MLMQLTVFYWKSSWWRFASAPGHHFPKQYRWQKWQLFHYQTYEEFVASESLSYGCLRASWIVFYIRYRPLGAPRFTLDNDVGPYWAAGWCFYRLLAKCLSEMSRYLLVNSKDIWVLLILSYQGRALNQWCVFGRWCEQLKNINLVAVAIFENGTKHLFSSSHKCRFAWTKLSLTVNIFISARLGWSLIALLRR